MAALSFCPNNFPACYPDSLHQNLTTNPDTVVFPQTKKRRSSSSSSSSLSFSNTYSFTNHVDPLILQTTNHNSYHHQSSFFSNPTNHNPFFSSALTPPQPLYSPLEYEFYDPNNDNNLDHSCYYGTSHYSDQPEFLFNNDQEPYFSGLIPEYDHYDHIDDQLLLAPLVPGNPDQNHNAMMINNNNAYNNNYCYHEQAEMVGNAGEDVIHETKKSSSSSKVVSPQSMAARERRRKITEKTQELAKLIPGATKMTTAEMFQAASNYVTFMKAQIAILQGMSKEEALGIEGLEVLGSPIVQEKLYLEDKCLVPKEFVDRASKANQTMFANASDKNDDK